MMAHGEPRNQNPPPKAYYDPEGGHDELPGRKVKTCKARLNGTRGRSKEFALHSKKR